MARSWGGTLARKLNDQSNFQAFRPQTGTATLVAGTVTVTGVVVTANSTILCQVAIPGGTLGTLHKVDNTTTTSFDITAIDTAGALVNTDTSTLTWTILS